MGGFMSKSKKLYILMMIATFVCMALFALSAIAFEFWDTYIPMIVILCLMVILFTLTIVIYYRYVKFTCPKCKQVFKPSASEITWSIHTPTKRLLKCPHCSAKSWCKEHFD